MMKRLLGILLGGWLLVTGPVVEAAGAQEVGGEVMLEGEVVGVVQEGKETLLDRLVPFQELSIRITGDYNNNEEIKVKNAGAMGTTEEVQYQSYELGDKVRILASSGPEGEEILVITGKVKRTALVNLLGLFLVSVILVGRKWGLLSLAGLAFSFLIIIKVIIPLLLKGVEPIWASILGAVMIIPLTFYISHGFNLKTHIGVIATGLSLLVTGFLAVGFVDWTYLTGFASEEAGFLQVERGGGVDIKGLLIAGIIIGVLGILDDITIGQASVVQQIKLASPKLSTWELFAKGMKVGQDHISSMVNTLVLVYAGSSLPLILLFFDDSRSFLDVIEFEPVAEEMVRMLVGSIGLVWAAPLATALAAFGFSRNGVKAKANLKRG